MNGNSYILMHKKLIEIKGWIKNDRSFTRHSLTLKCLGFVFTLNTHADKHYHILSKTLIFKIIEKHVIKDQEDFIKDVMGSR